MIYLEYFTFPDSDREFDFFVKQKRTCYDSFYPFQILSRHHLQVALTIPLFFDYYVIKIYKL